MAVCLMIAVQIGARFSRIFQPRYVTAFGMFFASLILLLFVGIDIKWTFWDISWRLGLFAAGLGLGLAPLTNAATSTVPSSEVGVASSILALARNLSGAFGVAIFATILTNTVTSSVITLQKYSIIHTVNPVLIKTAFSLLIVKANILAYVLVFKIAAIIMALGALAALFVRESKKDFMPKDTQIEI